MSVRDGRPRLTSGAQFKSWSDRWVSELRGYYGNNVHVADLLEHWPWSRRVFYDYVARYGHPLHGVVNASSS